MKSTLTNNKKVTFKFQSCQSYSAIQRDLNEDYFKATIPCK